MSQRRLVSSAIVATCAVATICYLMYGWNEIGAHVAARWTARFSALLFLVAFAQPGLSRWIAWFPSYAASVYTFVAALCVHFVTVVIVLSLDTTHHLRRNPKVGMAVIVIGSLNVLLAAITAGHRATRGARFVHALFLYPLFAIFMLAFASHHELWLRAVAGLLVAALLLRIAGGVMGARKATAVGSA